MSAVAHASSAAMPDPNSDEEEQMGLLRHGDSSQPAHAPAAAAAAGGTIALSAAAATVWQSGGFCILGSAFIFAVAAALVKAVGQYDPAVSLWQVIFVRSCLAMACSAGTARAQGISPLFGNRPYHWLALRGVLGTAAMSAFYFSLAKLPLADCITLLFLNPAFCALLGRVLLGERCGWRTVGGCLASLAGVVLVAQPPFILHLFSHPSSSSDGEQGQPGWSDDRLAGIALGVAGAVLASLAYITIRRIGKSSPSLSVACWFHAVSLVAGAVPLAAGIPKPAVIPNWRACLCLLGVGCTSFAAQLLLNRGFQLEQAARASAFNFTQVVWAHIIGVALFSEPLSLLGVAGAAIIAAGVLAVSLDKQAATAGAAEGAGPETGSSRLGKANGSFWVQPDDLAEASGGSSGATCLQLASAGAAGQSGDGRGALLRCNLPQRGS